MKTAAGSTNAADAGAPLVTDEGVDTTRLAAMNDVLVTALRSGITYRSRVGQYVPELQALRAALKVIDAAISTAEERARIRQSSQ